MIAFTIFGSSELQPWAVKHLNNGGVKKNLLLGTLSIDDIFFLTLIFFVLL